MKWLAGIAVAASLLVTPTVVLAQAPVDTKAEVQKLASVWMDAYNKQDAATIAQMYGDDAVLSTVFYTANGRAAIQDALKQDMAGGAKLTAITVDQSHRVGDMNYAAGAWAANAKGPDGKEAAIGGHWAGVSRYQNGQYIIMIHNSNTAMPPPK
jgi:ketosteroid isomerase-like protein